MGLYDPYSTAVCKRTGRMIGYSVRDRTAAILMYSFQYVFVLPDCPLVVKQSWFTRLPHVSALQRSPCKHMFNKSFLDLVPQG